MQVEYETQLIEPPTIRSSDFSPKENQSLDIYTLTQSTLNAIEYLISCPTGFLVAVYLRNANQVVILDTRTYTKREKFPLKSCNKNYSRYSFYPKAIDFSPDGTRLAIGQSDCIIYIYRLASQSSSSSSDSTATAKTVLTGKFVCSSPVTCLVWTETGIIFGTQDGKIKLVQMSAKAPLSENQTSSTKVIPVYSSIEASMPISLAVKSQLLVIGFINCSVVVIGITSDLLMSELVPNLVESGVATRRNSSVLPSTSIKHSCPPYHMIIIQPSVLCCAGPDGRISISKIHSDDSLAKLESQVSTSKQQNLTSLQNIDIKEDIVGIDYSQSNEILSIATTTRLLFIKYDQDQSAWQLENSFIEFNEAFYLTCFKWLRDGSQFVVGTLLGTVELFRCTWNKQAISEQLDICHIAKNKVRITDQARNLLATYKSQQYDIKKVNLLDGGQSVIIWTSNSLILARLGQSAQSELPWGRDRNVRFCFDDPGFVFIYNCNSHLLNLVRLGDDRILFSSKVYPATKSTICARQFPSSLFRSGITDNDKLSPNRQLQSADSSRSRHPSISIQQLDFLTQQTVETVNLVEVKAVENERLAFVLNSNSLVVVNLKENSLESRLQHSMDIKWIELSHTSNHIVFLDSSTRLYLVNLNDESKPLKANLVLRECEFAKWFPNSDILIAQNSFNILIWYNVNKLNNSTQIDSRLFNITKELPIIDLSLEVRAYPVVTKLDSSNYQLILSSGQVISLDCLRIKVFIQITNNRLEFALDILKKDDNDLRNLNLWNKLGWLAVERHDCSIAIQVFKKLNHEKLVRYLETCLQNPLELEWRLAMLRGDWVAFESLADPEQIVSTYKRLNKWSRVLDYLTRTQQFRQRDLVEQEFKDWLISQSRYLEAAQILAKSDDLFGGLELLISNEKYEDATDLFVADTSQLKKAKLSSFDVKLLDVAKKLKSKLIDKENFEKAALICDKILNETLDALDLYLRSSNYESALELAKKVAFDRKNEIEELLGESLMHEYHNNPNLKSRKKALKAIESFIQAGNKSRALDVAVELNQFERGFQILIDQKPDMSNEKSKENCKLIANFKLKNGKLEDAVKAFSVGAQYEQVVDLYVEHDQLKEAYETALKQVNSDDTEKTIVYFEKLGEKFSQTNNFEKAEKIYLLLERPDLAIEMHKLITKNYEKMLKLVEQYQPDQMEGTLLQLARELESEGRLEMAENYLLRLSDSEWTNVVRMYRLAGKWSDAFRVARDHCASEEDPLLVQLAYWWCKSLKTKDSSNNEAYELLERLNLFNQVLEFCCENKNFPLAIELSSCIGSPTRRSQVSRRFASFLEEQHKFKEAESVLINSGQVEEATKMYVDNDMPTEALRLVEGQLGNAADSALSEEKRESLINLLNKTLVRCADRIASEATKSMPENSLQIRSNNLLTQRQHIDHSTEKNLLVAQQMYLRAQKPELAVAMYKERGMWHQAIQVAQRFAPHLLESVEKALDEQLVSELPATKENSLAKTKKSTSYGNSNDSKLLTYNSIDEKDDQDSEPVEYLRGQVELLIREGNLGAAQVALDKFLDSLVEGGDRFQAEANGAKISLKLSELDRLLGENSHTLLEAAHNSDPLWNRVLTLSRWVLANSTWGQLQVSNVIETWTIWIKLRDLLLKCVKLSKVNTIVSEGLVEELKRHLLVTHWTFLLGCITCELEWESREESITSRANSRQSNNRGLDAATSHATSRLERMRVKLDSNGQALLSLVARLSISLLRYTNLLDERQVLYTVGLWSLALGNMRLTRIYWTKLLKFFSDGNSPDQGQSNIFVGQTGRVAKLSPIDERQVAGVRAWLLETLISSSSSSSSHAASGVQLDDDSQSVLVEHDDDPSAYCLVSGCPLSDEDLDDEKNQLVRLGSFRARKSDWKALQWASKHQSERSARVGPPRQMALRKVFEFMSNELSKTG